VIRPTPTFPAPGYTPLGAAGASHGMLAAPEPEPPPRSPNRRVLPVSSEPGLWAADEPTASTREPPRISGVEILVPTTDAGEFEARFCADKMERFLKSEGQVSALMRLRPDDRQCVVARLEAYCWESDLSKSESARRRETLEAALQQVRRFVQYACRNTRLPKPNVDSVFGAVTRAWEITAAQRARDVPRRRRR
jgi:hypothetical protein